MGNESFSDGKFDLRLTLLYGADEDRIEQWRRSFQRASVILYHATDGQMQFGKLTVRNDGLGLNQADVLLYEHAGRSASGFGSFMLLCNDERNSPYIVVHEFGHFAFDLREEYAGQQRLCTADTATKACIMEHGPKDGDHIDDAGNLEARPVNQFCDPCNHDSTANSLQETQKHQSCWETMRVAFPDLVIPPSGRTLDASVLQDHEDIDWQVLIPERRFVLVLDNAQELIDQPVSRGLHDAARFWIDYLAVVKAKLSINTSDGNERFALRSLDSHDNKQLALNAIDSLSPGPPGGNRPALLLGAQQLAAEGVPAATQAVALETSQAPPQEPPLHDLADRYRRVDQQAYAVHVGKYEPATELEQFTRATKGHFTSIGSVSDDLPTAFEAQNHLIELLHDVQGDSGMLAATSVVLPEPPAIAGTPPLHEDPDGLSRRPLRTHADSDGADLVAMVEKGCERATFALSQAEASSASLFVMSPDGTLARANQENVSYVDRPTWKYAFYSIRQPVDGAWTLRIRRTRQSGRIPLRLFAWSQNRRLHFGLEVTQVPDTRTIRIVATVLYDGPLGGLTPMATVVSREEVSNGRSRSLDTVLRGPVIPIRVGHTLLDDGRYEGRVDVGETGRYTVICRLINAGTAFSCSQCCDEGVPGGSIVPSFVRLKQRQISVV